MYVYVRMCIFTYVRMYVHIYVRTMGVVELFALGFLHDLICSEFGCLWGCFITLACSSVYVELGNSCPRVCRFDFARSWLHNHVVPLSPCLFLSCPGTRALCLLLVRGPPRAALSCLGCCCLALYLLLD